MSSPNSAGAPYASVQDWQNIKDVRFLEQIASDADAPVTAANLPSNPRLNQLLMIASGQVEASCAVGQRYQPQDLQDLTGASQQFLVWLVIELATGLAFLARPSFGPPPATFQVAQNLLHELSTGALVFGLTEIMKAGSTEVYVDSAADINALDLPTVQAQNLFGIRANRTNISGGFSTF